MRRKGLLEPQGSRMQGWQMSLGTSDLRHFRTEASKQTKQEKVVGISEEEPN